MFDEERGPSPGHVARIFAKRPAPPFSRARPRQFDSRLVSFLGHVSTCLLDGLHDALGDDVALHDAPKDVDLLVDSYLDTADLYLDISPEPFSAFPRSA